MLFGLLASSAQTGSRPLVDMTSGYFGLYEPYQQLLLKAANFDCRIVGASPKASFSTLALRFEAGR